MTKEELRIIEKALEETGYEDYDFYIVGEAKKIIERELLK